MKLSFLFIFSFQRIWGYQHFFTFFDLAISITFFKPQWSDLKYSLCVLGEGGFVSFDCLPLLLPAYLTINVNISFCLVSIILVEQFGIESWNLTSRPEVGLLVFLYIGNMSDRNHFIYGNMSHWFLFLYVNLKKLF